MFAKLLLALSSVVVVPAALLFHLELKSAVPEKDAILSAPPAVVTLTFTAKANARLSAIAILRPDSTEVMKLTVAATKEPNTLQGTLSRPLPPGRYVVRWRTAAADGHVVRGAYGFSVDVIE